MSEFVVRSNHASDHLKVWIINVGDQRRALIDFGDLTAEAKVYERHSGEALRLDRYFADMAAHWHGWEGEKGMGGAWTGERRSSPPSLELVPR